MKIGIIIGSSRKNSQSERIGYFLNDLISKIDEQIECEMFKISELDVPLWNEGMWEKESNIKTLWKPINDKLKTCDSFIVISPEWAGMATPHLKNFLLMANEGSLDYKSALLVGISSGMGGAYPIAELRMSGYKNNHIWWMPEHLIFRFVENLFNGENSEIDNELTKRSEAVLKLLINTTKAMKPVIENIGDLKDFPYGM